MGVLTATAAAIATRVRLLPEVVDLSFVLTGAGFGSLLGAAYGVLRGYEPDRVARISLGFSLLFAGATALLLFAVLLTELIQDRQRIGSLRGGQIADRGSVT